MFTKPREREIQQQLAQLRWRKAQNERSIRNYLETTKVMKQKDTILGLTIDQSAERMQWLDSIVRDELARPLVLNDDELHQIQYEENKMKKRLAKYSQQQLESLNKVASNIESREPRTKDGKEIREEQLQRFDSIKRKLAQNIVDIDHRQPYITVKEVVPKLF
eukprot:gene7858-8497_t